jgi:hypothetical protein
LSQDGKRLAGISVHQEGNHYQLNLLEASTGKVLLGRPVTGDWFHSRFTPDGLAVSVETDSALRFEDVRTGRELGAIPGSLGHSVVFSPDGRLVAVGIIKRVKDSPGGGGWHVLGIQIAELATGKEIFHTEGPFDHFDFSRRSSVGRLGS